MDLQHVLWWLSLGTEFTLLASLVLRKIAAAYRWFATCIAFGVARGLALHFVGNPNSSRTYAIVWMVTEPVLLMLLVLTTTEIIAKVPQQYRAFGSFGRRRLRQLLHVALVIALLSSTLEAAGPNWHLSVKALLQFLFALHRIATSTLAIYLVLVAFFVSRVPVPFQQNLRVHSRLFACYLSLQTAIMLVAVAIGHGTPAIDDALTGGSALLFLLWTIMLTRSGEALPPRRSVSSAEILQNEERERALQETVKRYSDRPLG